METKCAFDPVQPQVPGFFINAELELASQLSRAGVVPPLLRVGAGLWGSGESGIDVRRPGKLRGGSGRSRVDEWVETSNGLRCLGFFRAANLLAGPVLLNSTFSSTSEGAAAVIPRASKLHP